MKQIIIALTLTPLSLCALAENKPKATLITDGLSGGVATHASNEAIETNEKLIKSLEVGAWDKVEMVIGSYAGKTWFFRSTTIAQKSNTDSYAYVDHTGNGRQSLMVRGLPKHAVCRAWIDNNDVDSYSTDFKTHRSGSWSMYEIANIEKTETYDSTIYDFAVEKYGTKKGQAKNEKLMKLFNSNELTIKCNDKSVHKFSFKDFESLYKQTVFDF